VSEKLFCLLEQESGLMLDIGCGTGYFQELLRKNKIYQPLVQTDIASQMCKIAANYASLPEYGITSTCTSDMHHLPFADNSFVNVFSSMTIQWSHNIRQVFSEIKRVLQEKGRFTLSIVAQGSLAQLYEAFEAAGYKPPIYQFANLDYIKQELCNCGLAIENIYPETITLQFKNIYDIIRSVKAVGASYKENPNSGIKGKGYFASTEKIYREKFERENSLPLSWEIIYVAGKK
jgi:malonyl-CoA O-methyltransferase